jgi:serine/threonine protein kinase
MTFISDAAIARLQGVAIWPEFVTDRYVVTGEIGRGGMGAVYLAHDQALGRDVAIKVSNALARDGADDRLQREARILARLEHPGIVPVHDAGRLADGRLFYVMKEVRGTTLRVYVERRHGLGERLTVFERICDAVAFAHARQVVHRDLAPDNVMVGEFGEVLVLDWGLATLAESGGEAAGTVAGTRGFMAPEQARGATAEIGPLADVYGLGGILYLLATGTPPAAEMPQRLASTPRPLRAICLKALAADPRDRYQSVEALAADVARYRAGDAVEAHRENPLERAARFGRTYRTPILLVLAYIIMRALVAWLAGR